MSNPSRADMPTIRAGNTLAALRALIDDMRVGRMFFVTATLCGCLFATKATACGFPGQFGNCLARGQFDSSMGKPFAAGTWDAGSAAMRPTRAHRWSTVHAQRWSETNPSNNAKSAKPR
jgi:hypothetical protein